MDMNNFWSWFYILLCVVIFLYGLSMTVIALGAIFSSTPKRKKYFIVYRYFVNNMTYVKAKNEQQAVEKFIKQSYFNESAKILGIFEEENYQEAIKLMNQ